MNRKIGNDEELRAALGGLPRDITPGRELWPEISARLTAAPGGRHRTAVRSAWPGLAAAASVAIAFAFGLLFGRFIGPDDGLAVPAEARSVAMLAALEASEREYYAAFREFIPLGAARELLTEQERFNIEAGWLDLQQAESALLAALAEHPGNPFLNQKLLDLRAQQLEFMRQLATLDQFSRRRT